MDNEEEVATTYITDRDLRTRILCYYAEKVRAGSVFDNAEKLYRWVRRGDPDRRLQALNLAPGGFLEVGWVDVDQWIDRAEQTLRWLDGDYSEEENDG